MWKVLVRLSLSVSSYGGSVYLMREEAYTSSPARINNRFLIAVFPPFYGRWGNLAILKVFLLFIYFLLFFRVNSM